MKKFELSIPKPCHENWDKMTPEAKGRFCGACNKTVMDFTNMSDRQLAEFFKQPSGSVCGRFENGQLNRVLEVPSKRIPWIKYFFTIAIPAFLFSTKAAAQGKVTVKDSIGVVPVNKKVAEMPVAANENKKRITVGRVSRVKLSSFKVEKIAGDSSLFVKAPCLPVPGEAVNIKRENAEPVSLMAVLGMVVKSKPVIKKEVRAESQQPKQQMDSNASFLIYPNPVKTNTIFNLEIKGLPEGRYGLAILTSTGGAVKNEELIVEKKLMKYSVMLNNMAAGPYFIQLTNLQTAKHYTEIIIVE